MQATGGRRVTALAAAALLLVVVTVVSLRAHAAGPVAGLPHVGTAQAVERDDVGDPYVLPAPHGVTGDPSARYVLFWTTDWRSNVPTAVSSDLVHWHRIADALPVLPSWATPNRTMTWGPSASAVPGGYALFFSTQDAASGFECLGRAFSTNPAGPFVDHETAPLVCQAAQGGDIDPSVTHAGAGLALVWKNDGNARRQPTYLWEQTLTADGSAVTGSVHRLLGVDAAWEHGIIEGPSLLPDSRGGWWLLFSGGAWQSNTYDTGAAHCVTVAGPCSDASATPILSSAPGAISPGGMETFVDGSGKLWASYSAFPSRPASQLAAMKEDRVLEIAPLTGT